MLKVAVKLSQDFVFATFLAIKPSNTASACVLSCSTLIGYMDSSKVLITHVNIPVNSIMHNWSTP